MDSVLVRHVNQLIDFGQHLKSVLQEMLHRLIFPINWLIKILVFFKFFFSLFKNKKKTEPSCPYYPAFVNYIVRSAQLRKYFNLR